MATFLIRTNLTSRLIDAENADMAQHKFVALCQPGIKYGSEEIAVHEASDEEIESFKKHRSKKPGEGQIRFAIDVEPESKRRTNPT